MNLNEEYSIEEAFKELNREIVNESLNEENEDNEWHEIKSFEEMQKFGKGAHWAMCYGGDSDKIYYDNFAKEGKFFGKGEGNDRQLKLVKNDGSVFGPFDVNDKKVEESVSEEFEDEFDEDFAEEECCPECGKCPCECEKELGDETIDEDVASSMPVQFLPVNEVKEFVLGLPEPDPHTPPRFFKLGYMKELGPEIPSKFRGGRGSEGNPFVRIFKATEYSALYTGTDWRGTNATKAADKVLGAERHTGEKTGFGYDSEDAVANRIGVYRDGSEALQAYIADHSQQRVKFFISLDDEDLHEASREEVAEYLTPAHAAKILTPGSARVAAGVDAEGNNVYDKPINRFKLNNIYMIGNLGHSIIR